MKELNIQEKAHLYDEAIERANELLYVSDKESLQYKTIKHILPYLTESDERIRKALIRFHKSTIDIDGIKGEEIIDWLEKKGKNNMGISESTKKKLEDNLNKALEKETPESWNKFLDEQCEQKHVVIIPKFRIGDEIKTSNEESLTITKIDEKGYWSDNLFICDFGDASKWHLVEQNPAWSEEDEDMCYKATAVINRLCAEGKEYVWSIKTLRKLFYWLKSIKNKVQHQQKKEWGEEDENRINRLIAYFEDKESFTAEDDIVYANWLKCLKDRYTWKPSDEQMDMLKIAVSTSNSIVLDSLYNDLMKLKE